VRVDLHTHTADDPSDRIPHTTRELIDHAASLGYGGLAITLHDRWLDPAPHVEYARERGVTLIAGIERTIGRSHVLLIDAPREAERVRTWADLDALKRSTGLLVVAPHPFYPIPSAIGPELDTHAHLIDAVEHNAMYTRAIDFNRRATEWARTRGVPVVGNTDLHRLAQMGTTSSIVDVAGAASPREICDAIRAGRVRVETRPLSTVRAAWLFGRMVLGDLLIRERALPEAP
jgi:predicted metal-dependent phosphoesterase TrpH